MSAAKSASGKTGRPSHPERSSEGVKDTLDSIIIAFILAFVFRAFIIEAFVIPTGSMAATLNGAHGTMVCENCGWEFSYGLSDRTVHRQAAHGQSSSVDSTVEAYCPNCNFGNRTEEINESRQNQESGDRILVFKWPFDIGGELLGPHRWDVIVFKDPSDGTTNYIKRLGGLPNEVLEIIDGDVYTVPTGEVSEEALATLDQARHIKYLRRTSSDHREADRLEEELQLAYEKMLNELDGKLRIQHKTDLAQEALWTVVYDHDYPPQELGAIPPRSLSQAQPRWQPDSPESAWSVKPRVLRFSGVDRPAERIQLFATFNSRNAYNIPLYYHRIAPLWRPVSDLRTRFVIDYKGGEGSLAVQLIKRHDLFVGEISADGTVRLLRGDVGSPTEMVELEKTKIAPLEPGKFISFSVENLDHRVAISVNDEVVLATSPEDYAPKVHDLRTNPTTQTLPPAIVARDLDLALLHVVVEKDVYYVSYVSEGARPLGAGPWGTENHPIWLREGEHFALGDNSLQSKDSRLWDEVGQHLVARGEEYQLGTVPEDQLIGRAFFVYWPAGLRTKVIPMLKNVGWIPNFGKMRWIR